MKKIIRILTIFPILHPVGYLNDFSNLLSQTQKEKIEKRLIEIEKETTNEIVVLIIKSLEGRNIEEYANLIFNTWKIGKKGKDNGVLIFIAFEDRQIRIEVGYGLESILTDSICGRIIRDVMAPQFRKNDYYNGIKEAIETIYKITKGEIVEIRGTENVPPVQFRIFWYFLCILFGFLILGLLGMMIQFFIILFLSIFVFLNRNTPFYEIFIILSLLIPFFFIFILSIISSFVFAKLRKKLKKFYGNKWRNHIPFYLNGPYIGSSHSGSRGFSGNFGGFGGGASGGGGATGRW